MNPNTYKICLLIPYFGKWPQFSSFFVNSVGKSNVIDVIFITDLPQHPQSFSNIQYIHMSLENVRKLAETTIGTDIVIDEPYKLCDLKPAYGLIFEEYIQGYSHWAFGDIDVIYGRDLDHFVHDWQSYDILTFREDWLTGSLTIIRNQSATNRLFAKSVSYKHVFANPQYIGFDECMKKFDLIINKGPDAILVHDNAQSFTWLVRNEELEHALKVYRKKIINEYIPWKNALSYNDGVLIQSDGTELLYYHLIKEKSTPIFSFPNWSRAPKRYWIDRYGFWMDTSGIFKGSPSSKKNSILIYIRHLMKGTMNRIRHLTNNTLRG